MEVQIDGVVLEDDAAAEFERMAKEREAVTIFVVTDKRERGKDMKVGQQFKMESCNFGPVCIGTITKVLGWTWSKKGTTLWMIEVQPDHD